MVDPMLVATDNLTLVKGILDRMLASGDIQPLLDGFADDVTFRVATPHGSPDPYRGDPGGHPRQVCAARGRAEPSAHL
jgi:hypothetical protein